MGVCVCLGMFRIRDNIRDKVRGRVRFRVRIKTKFRVSLRVKTRVRASVWVRFRALFIVKLKIIDIDRTTFGYGSVSISLRI